MNKKILTGLFVIFTALLTSDVPLVLAASSSYYAVTTVYFNVPSDATFNIALPSGYTNTSITGTSEPGTATSWISFNYTAVPQATLAQPWVIGASADAQAGGLKPIFLIYNTGNVNETINLRTTGSPATGIQLFFNASCATSSCTTATTALTEMTTGYLPAVASLYNGKALNVTLWSNTSSAVNSGTSSVTMYTQSVATA